MRKVNASKKAKAVTQPKAEKPKPVRVRVQIEKPIKDWLEAYAVLRRQSVSEIVVELLERERSRNFAVLFPLGRGGAR